VTENKTFKRGQTGFPVGNFLGSDGTEFRVESGFIGIIPYEKLSVDESDARYFGFVRHFKQPVQFISRNGFFTILSGKYILDIDTYQINSDDEFTFQDYNATCEEEEEDEEDEEEDEEEEEEEEEEEDEEDDEEEDEEEEDEEEEKKE
jgi:hypothetical protein